MINIQNAIYKRLDSFAGLDALLARYRTFQGSELGAAAIYTDVPQDEFSEDDSFFPYISMGNDTVDQWDTDTTEGYEAEIVIDAWTRGNTSSGYTSPKRQAKLIAEQVRLALHQHELDVTGSDTVFLHFQRSAFIQEPDGKTYHASMRFRLITDNV